jgi:short-subunit dehydrogenase
MHFKDKVVVITGGTDGIGKALVNLFINQQAKVATCGRNHDKLYSLVADNAGKSLHTMVADVSNENDCNHFINSVIDTYGRIDILINNAGISMRSMVTQASLDTLRQVMDVNFYGTVYCTKFALPSIIENKGIIVGVSSIAGYRGLPGRSAYCASKHAVNGWLEALRSELRKTGVHVMWVAPGFVKSQIRFDSLNAEGQKSQGSTMDEDKLMSPETCAKIIAKAIENKKRNIIMTIQGKIAVLLNKLWPSLADKQIDKFYFKNGELIK